MSFTSAKAGTFSGVHRARPEREIDPHSPEFFSHAETVRSQRDVSDESGGSSGQTSARKLFGGPPMHTDSRGHPVFSNNELTAGAHGGADRIRGRTLRSSGGSPADAHDLSIASERHRYPD